MDIFLAAFDDIRDPRADNARHDLCDLPVAGFVAVHCGASSCAEMAEFGREKEHVFRGFLKPRHSIPSQDTVFTVVRMIDPKALDAAFDRVLAQIAVPPGNGDVIVIDGKALRDARDPGQSARSRMMVPSCAAAPSTLPDATPPRGRSWSNSSAQVGTMRFFSAFSIRKPRHSSNAIALPARPSGRKHAKKQWPKNARPSSQPLHLKLETWL
ncbi:MAG: transposase family protein [Rhodobacter sp.]|nr:transposase family protein [Rhodobacter sp.]